MERQSGKARITVLALLSFSLRESGVLRDGIVWATVTNVMRTDMAPFRQ